MGNLGAANEIPCYFIPKSVVLNFGQNYSGEKIHFTCRRIGFQGPLPTDYRQGDSLGSIRLSICLALHSEK